MNEAATAHLLRTTSTVIATGTNGETVDLGTYSTDHASEVAAAARKCRNISRVRLVRSGVIA